MTLVFRLLPEYFLLLLVISATSASLLRASSRQTPSDERDLMTLQLGCPGKECQPLSFFQALDQNILDTALCENSGDCSYNMLCMHVPGDKLMCADHAQGKVTGSVCNLECLEYYPASGGGTVTCTDIKTCMSLKDILTRTNNPNLTSSGCKGTDDCSDGECRYKIGTNGALDELVCDDTSGTYCGSDCVVDDTTESRNVAFGNSEIGAEAASSTSGVFPCASHKMCVSLSLIIEEVSNNPNLDGGDCTGTDDCEDGECRYDDVLDELKCDDSIGSYCSKDCVEDDLQSAAQIALMGGF